MYNICRAYVIFMHVRQGIGYVHACAYEIRAESNTLKYIILCICVIIYFIMHICYYILYYAYMF